MLWQNEKHWGGGVDFVVYGRRFYEAKGFRAFFVTIEKPTCWLCSLTIPCIRLDVQASST